MIGNDIIDLKMADHEAWRRKRYLDKIFHPVEQELIGKSAYPSLCLWQLWSMKESAYKSHFRKKDRRRFNPIQLRCFLSGGESDVFDSGVVRIEGCEYLTHSVITGDYIHTTARLCSKQRLQIQSGIVCSKEASDLRPQIIEALKTTYSDGTNLRPENIIFEKDSDRIPYLRISGSLLSSLYAGKSSARPCSISHHGDYGAFAFLS